MEVFRSVEYQRTFQYLKMFDSGVNMDNFRFTLRPLAALGDQAEALKIIIQ